LRELQSLGLDAIELGSPGFLPRDSAELKTVLDAHSTDLVGGFVPLVLHDPAKREKMLGEAHEIAALFASVGARNFITCAVVDEDWGPRYPLSDAQWSHLVAMFAELDNLCASYGLEQVLHPHVNTVIETAADVQYVLDHSSVKWCLDTGHLAIGGYNPAEFAQRYGDRVGMLHLKDVDLSISARLETGEATLMQATIDGMFRSLGEGDVDVAGTIQAVLQTDFDGYIVLEQDISITGEPPAEGTGPVEDIRSSLDFVRAQIAAFEAGSSGPLAAPDSAVITSVSS
jgi:inosose dehydratase